MFHLCENWSAWTDDFQRLAITLGVRHNPQDDWRSESAAGECQAVASILSRGFLSQQLDLCCGRVSTEFSLEFHWIVTLVLWISALKISHCAIFILEWLVILAMTSTCLLGHLFPWAKCSSPFTVSARLFAAVSFAFSSASLLNCCSVLSVSKSAPM